jgi:hypothetical protein
MRIPLLLLLACTPACAWLGEARGTTITGGLSFEERVVLRVFERGRVRIENNGAGTIELEVRGEPADRGIRISLAPGESIVSEFTVPLRYVLEHAAPGLGSIALRLDRGRNLGYAAEVD